LKPVSFVTFHKKTETFEVQKRSTAFHDLGNNDILKIFDSANCFEIIPSDYLGKYNDFEISQNAPKIKNKSMKQIAKQAGIEWVNINDYCEINIISTHVEETSKVIITYYLIESVFKFIPMLNIILVDGKNIDLSYYSYRSILEKSGIKLEDTLPYLKTKIEKVDRKDISVKNIPLYEKVKVREVKDRIKANNLAEKNVEIYMGNEPLNRYNKTDFDFVEEERNEASNLLYELIEKVENKKNEINTYLEDVNNLIIEIKDVNNNVVYIRRRIYDEIVADPETNFNEYKTDDIFGNEILVSKEDLPNYAENPNLIKIYKKDSPKEEFVLTDFT
jgi:hypothetical protein